MSGRQPYRSQPQRPGSAGSNYPPQQRERGSDVYHQLIDGNDMVKELDDIEAISQQIRQHADVLYQSWKNNTIGGPNQFQTIPGPSSGPSYQRSLSNPPSGPPASNYSQERSVSVMDHNGKGHHTVVKTSSSHNGGPVHTTYEHTIEPQPRIPSHDPPRLSMSNTSDTYSRLHSPTPNPPTRLHHQIAQSQQLHQQVPKAATLPTRGSSGKSVTHISGAASGGGGDGALDLLSAPEVNGNLKDLVNSFVSTDRAKQAARQTISTTINNMTKKNGGLRSPSPSNSSSPFSSRGVSPLKSPMLAANSVSSSSSMSSSNAGPLSPSGSSTTSSVDSQRSTSTARQSPIPIAVSSPSMGAVSRMSPYDHFGPPQHDIHTKMQPMFNIPMSRGNQIHQQQHQIYQSQPLHHHHNQPTPPPPSSSGHQGGIHTKMQPMFTSSSAGLEKPWPSTSSATEDSISIPVQHLNSPAGSSGPPKLTPLHIPTQQQQIQHQQENCSGAGLQSPRVLQTISKRTSNRNSLEFDMPLPNLHAQNVERMKQRFEEAKQRINMMHQRAMDSGLMARSSPGFSNVRNSFESRTGAAGGDEQDSFLDFPKFGEIDEATSTTNLMLEQLRRRTARRRDTPAAPHPELTPQQKQHIFERSVTPNTLNYNSQGFPLRRFLSGGSVAERVMIFERCPVFSPELKESRIPSNLVEKKREPAIASWRNNLHEVQNKTQVGGKKCL